MHTHPTGLEYGSCIQQTERETQFYPGAHCNDVTHPYDDHCEAHGGLPEDEALEPEHIAELKDCEDEMRDQTDLTALAEYALPLLNRELADNRDLLRSVDIIIAVDNRSDGSYFRATLSAFWHKDVEEYVKTITDEDDAPTELKAARIMPLFRGVDDRADAIAATQDLAGVLNIIRPRIHALRTEEQAG